MGDKSELAMELGAFILVLTALVQLSNSKTLLVETKEETEKKGGETWGQPRVETESKEETEKKAGGTWGQPRDETEPKEETENEAQDYWAGKLHKGMYVCFRSAPPGDNSGKTY